MQIADFDFTQPAVTLGFSPLPYQNGIAVKDMTAGTSASSFVVDVTVGSAKFTVKDAPDIQLKAELHRFYNQQRAANGAVADAVRRARPPRPDAG